MDLYTKFNKRNILDRQIDTLIGISKGLVSDGKIDQGEAEFLLTWLIQNQQYGEHPIIENLLQKVSQMLQDDFLDEDESTELLGVLQSISGEKSEIGELAKPTTLPVDNPAPEIVFSDKIFLFTGTCVFGTRKECQAAVMQLGGLNASNVTKSLNYLVIGTYVTDSWAHETYGRKIEKAMSYRESGLPIAIITEETWIKQAGF
ncbi:BRCT domain-containing protein [Haliea sp. E17]|uniref:BRCT domain-containing protein n=1 Tax=Haliea sp. E17 TaxID=3401576 RepID=UPI003AAB70DA